jgi:hypothetical protein
MLFESTGEISFCIIAILIMGMFFRSADKMSVNGIAAVAVLMSFAFLKAADEVFTVAIIGMLVLL